MISAIQLAANRANALKSTGPGQDAKPRVRLNAKRDGITGQIVTLSDEDRPVFEALKAELINDLAPQTVMEQKLASAIAWDTWRLDRLRATEMSLYALGAADPENAVTCDDPEIQSAMISARTFCRMSHQFELMSLYEQRMSRNVHKNLTALRALQTERKLSADRERKDEISLARASEIHGQPYQAAAASATNGFVFSNDEIRAAAARQLALEVAESTLHVTPHKVQIAAAASTPEEVRTWKHNKAA